MSSLGLTASQMQSLNNAMITAELRKLKGSSYSSSGSKNSSSSIFAVSESGNTCTDGKDDGKIGIPLAACYIAKGAVNSVVNMVKGCFTDSEGNFSLGKTLFTAGLGAACAVFPAAGLALGAFGIVTSLVKTLSSAANALNADTDAQAKDMWEQVGEGGVSLGLSFFGTKASYNGVMKSSTAGAMKNLSDNATLLQKAAALGKDMRSSTVNNFTKLRAGISNQLGVIKEVRQQKYNVESAGKYAERLGYTEKLANAQAKMAETPMGQAQTVVKAKLSNLGKSANTAETAAGTAKTINPFSTVKTTIGKMLEKKGGDGVIKTLQNTVKSNGGLIKTVVSKLSDSQKAIYNALTNENASYNQIVSEYGYENVIGVLELLGAYNLLDESI